MIGKRGVFITITAFLLAGMLLLSAANLAKIKALEEDSITLALAAQKTQFHKENLTDSIKSTYRDAGIVWDVNDNNRVIYRETLPELTKKNKIIQNLSKISSFFYHEFPNSGTYNPETIDTGTILVLGKDMNITHSATGGFGTNREIRYVFTAKQFHTITFDINSDAASLQLMDQNLTLCSGCANPLTLHITIRNAAGTVAYSFDNTINLSQTGTLDLNSTPAVADINLTYGPTSIVWTNTVSTVVHQAKIDYNDPLLSVGTDPNAIHITQLQAFGVIG